MAKRFGPDERYRQVPAEFLALLVTGELPHRVHRHEVQVAQAVIVSQQGDRLDLTQATVPHKLEVTSYILLRFCPGCPGHFNYTPKD